MPINSISDSEWRKIQLLRLAFDIVDGRETYSQLESHEERIEYIIDVAEKLLQTGDRDKEDIEDQLRKQR